MIDTIKFFKEKKYVFIKEMIPRDIAKVATQYSHYDRASNFNPEDENAQIPGSHSVYGDPLMETLLNFGRKTIEKSTGLELWPTYSYYRLYKVGDVLKRHKDRFSCEISTTMNLGGDEWPIYLSPNENVGRPDGKKITVSSKAKGVEVILKPGDMLVYKGMILEHWREVFLGEDCAQVFLHYNNKAGQFQETNAFDGRPMLGLPDYYKKAQ